MPAITLRSSRLALAPDSGGLFAVDPGAALQQHFELRVAGNHLPRCEQPPAELVMHMERQRLAHDDQVADSRQRCTLRLTHAYLPSKSPTVSGDCVSEAI
jgi:hypothetical protein